MRHASALLALALLAATAAAPARAQDNPALQEAVRLAGEGRGDAARRLVAAELAKARVGDSAYVEALFWRARLAATGDSAERDLRRIAIEFPGSRWADDALLQLTQLAMAAGNPASAFALGERLRSDYPGSELRPQAALWAGRAAFDLGDARGACALLDSARSEGGADVEFVNRVAFYHARCTALPAVPAPGQPAAGPDSARPSPRPSTPQAATSRGGTPTAARPGEFAIQVAAVRTEAEAARVLKRIADAGLSGHAAAGSDGLRRVRVGAYATEREAQDALAAVRRALGGRPFVVRER